MRGIKTILLALGLAALASAAGAQQITRIAVVDLSRVIETYSKDSGPWKAFEQKKSQIQSDIDRMGTEIKQLQAQKLQADQSGDSQASLQLETQIFNKTQFLREYIQTKQNELDAESRRLTASSEFVQSVYKQIQDIAQSDGYSMVLNLKSNDSVMNSVIWYSPMIDITDKVIAALMGTPTQAP
ncbi:MAG TPA: OmpH family outer membrane protein [Rectinemataceae bacterium]|nr:OmpH family outer membrane protein [Rectinemataceae bacterium]